MSDFLSKVITKNKSYGVLTSKALSEIDKQSLASGMLSPNQSTKRFGASPDRKNQGPTLQDFDQNSESPGESQKKKRRQSKVLNPQSLKQQIEQINNSNGGSKNDSSGASPEYKNRNKLKKYDNDFEGDQGVVDSDPV